MRNRQNRANLLKRARAASDSITDTEDAAITAAARTDPDAQPNLVAMVISNTTPRRRPSSILPDSLPPIGVNREQAAAYIGISATSFDRLVYEGIMPDARILRGRLVWDVAEIADAFRAIPHRSESTTTNPWG